MLTQFFWISIHYLVIDNKRHSSAKYNKTIRELFGVDKVSCLNVFRNMALMMANIVTNHFYNNAVFIMLNATTFKIKCIIFMTFTVEKVKVKRKYCLYFPPILYN